MAAACAAATTGLMLVGAEGMAMDMEGCWRELAWGPEARRRRATCCARSAAALWSGVIVLSCRQAGNNQ